MQRLIIIILILFSFQNSWASYILIPMDENQKNHLKAYGLTYWVLQNGIEAQWLLNYRGGSFLIQNNSDIQTECAIRGISIEVIADGQAAAILEEISREDVNMDNVKLEKAPKIAVYSPKGKQPWDDAVTLVLTYAQIPYDIVYDAEILEGKLADYDWLHLHHEDFTGQYGKFYAAYHHMKWYQDQVKENEDMAARFGFGKVSQLKLAVAKTIKEYVNKGGFLFAMCSATDSYDIALAAEGVDICESMYDGDGADPNAQEKLDFSKTFAFTDFTISKNPMEYEYSNIDATQTRKVSKESDYFTLFDFSAKWDPVPSMLTQNHTYMVKGFMGQTTAYNNDLIKSDVLIMGENKAAGEARYLHSTYGKGMWTFYGGHDPADYRHLVYDPVTDLDAHPNSAGYRLILNNVLFPAAKKKKLKT
jgi:hypothetical protein